MAVSPLGHDRSRAVVERFLAGNATAAQLAWLLGRVVLWHQVCIEGTRDPFG